MGLALQQLGGGARESGVYNAIGGPGVAKVSPHRGGRYAQLNPRRRWARDRELEVFSGLFGPSEEDAIARGKRVDPTSSDPEDCKVTDLELAKSIGSPHDNQGAKVRCGGMPITPGECMLLLPLRVAGLAFVSLFRARAQRESVGGDMPNEARRNLRLILTHLDAIEVLLTA